MSEYRCPGCEIPIASGLCPTCRKTLEIGKRAKKFIKRDLSMYSFPIEWITSPSLGIRAIITVIQRELNGDL